MSKFKLADFLRRWDGIKPEDKMAATTCLEMKISGGGEEASDAILLLTSKQSTHKHHFISYFQTNRRRKLRSTHK